MQSGLHCLAIKQQQQYFHVSNWVPTLADLPRTERPAGANLQGAKLHAVGSQRFFWRLMPGTHSRGEGRGGPSKSPYKI